MGNHCLWLQDDVPFSNSPPPQPDSFSLQSSSSLNVDQLKARNEERLRRLNELQKKSVNLEDFEVGVTVHYALLPVIRAVSALWVMGLLHESRSINYSCASRLALTDICKAVTWSSVHIFFPITPWCKTATDALFRVAVLCSMVPSSSLHPPTT
ncbi:Centrosome and spindle pole-associated protein 1 [Chelonia mydas]|uniref:Centrosome and spindle pole-associated protein 1 n=1 Tax=Chelonia mydas TaxID=8469 RepID=M7BVI7_CHEMY|nr:Centrosome and spindle pole-associated protein 1 [Chelonia mydas]